MLSFGPQSTPYAMSIFTENIKLNDIETRKWVKPSVTVIVCSYIYTLLLFCFFTAIFCMFKVCVSELLYVVFFTGTAHSPLKSV